MFYKTALLGAVAFGFTVSATAQTASIEETKLDTIIVNGSRLDQTMTEIGSSVSVITRDDLEELGVDFALDAIATAPGVTVNQNGAFGGNASVRIRGASNDQTLVLIDGVPVNDPTGTGGGYNFAYLDTDTIERIEVLKGPQPSAPQKACQARCSANTAPSIHCAAARRSAMRMKSVISGSRLPD